jgi:hypothetical protein
MENGSYLETPDAKYRLDDISAFGTEEPIISETA